MRDLTHEEICWIISKMETYIDLAGGSVGVPDPSHSALLYRLLSGKDPLPIAPPKSYSRPNYHLGEGSPCVVEAFILEGEEEAVCDQCRYKIVRKESDNTYLLEYEQTGQRFRLWRQHIYNVKRRKKDGSPAVICKGDGILILVDSE